MTSVIGNQEEWDAIRAVVQDYFDGLYHSDVARLKSAFHPQAQVTGHFQGRFGVLPLDQFLSLVEQTSPPAEKGEAYDMEAVSADITGDVAAVKVTDLYMGMRFTDYLTLMKVAERWTIIHKAYRHD